MTKHFTIGKDDLTGSSSAYYKLPEDATDIQDLIEYRNMNFAQGNILKAIYRIGEKPGVDAIYDLEKIIWFSNREINRLSKNNVNSKKVTNKQLPEKRDILDIYKNLFDVNDESIKAEEELISTIMKNIDLNAPVGVEEVPDIDPLEIHEAEPSFEILEKEPTDWSSYVNLTDFRDQYLEVPSEQPVVETTEPAPVAKKRTKRKAGNVGN